MSRPHYYAHGTVTRSLSLAVDTDAALDEYARREGYSRSQVASELIMEALGKEPPEKADDET